MNMYGRYNYWQSLYEKNWTFTFYCHKNFVNCSNFRAVFIFYLTARIRLNLIRAVEIFLSSSWHFEKKCWAVKIRADGFRAVHRISQIENRETHLDNIILAFSKTASHRVRKRKWVTSLDQMARRFFFSLFKWRKSDKRLKKKCWAKTLIE
jgi:hypothetical protein